MLFSGPIAHGRTMGFYVYGVRDRESGAAARLEGLKGFVQRLYRRGRRRSSSTAFARERGRFDEHLARFLKYVRDFLRAAPPDA